VRSARPKSCCKLYEVPRARGIIAAERLNPVEVFTLITASATLDHAALLTRRVLPCTPCLRVAVALDEAGDLAVCGRSQRRLQLKPLQYPDGKHAYLSQ
jgi:hypothetical protein